MAGSKRTELVAIEPSLYTTTNADEETVNTTCSQDDSTNGTVALGPMKYASEQKGRERKDTGKETINLKRKITGVRGDQPTLYA